LAAIQSYSEAIELDPSNHVYYSNRSTCLAEMSRFAEAKADGERCILIDPTFVKGKLFPHGTSLPCTDRPSQF